MYVSDEDLETTVLRQGDILKSVHRFGALNPSGITHGIGQDGKEVAWTVPVKRDFGLAVVISHSCEIDPENDIKLTSVILAPIRNVHDATSPSKVADLISSNLIDDDNREATFLKYFYLEPNEKLPFEDGCVADFSKLFSVRRNFYQGLVDEKIIQMTREVADKMAFKLGLYFYRT